jgi:RNA polymerase sigma-32 factor
MKKKQQSTRIQKAKKKETDSLPKDDTESPPERPLAKYDPLQRYLWEIGQHKLLTREEEIELGTRVMEHGDREAAYKLITANLRLVSFSGSGCKTCST